MLHKNVRLVMIKRLIGLVFLVLQEHHTTTSRSLPTLQGKVYPAVADISANLKEGSHTEPLPAVTHAFEDTQVLDHDDYGSMAAFISKSNGLESTEALLEISSTQGFLYCFNLSGRGMRLGPFGCLDLVCLMRVKPRNGVL